MENKDWLNDLKVGDKVIVVTEHYGSRGYEIRQIDRITPTKQIVVDGRRFKNGELPTSDIWSPVRVYLIQATEDEIARVNNIKYKQSVFRKLRELKSITYEQARAIAEVFGWDIPIEQ